MKGFTHIAAGTLIGITLANTLCPDTYNDALLMIGTSIIGSILPDIDIGTSKLGRRLPMLSYPIQFLFGHRGIFHSLLLWLVPLLYLYWVYPAYRLFVLSGGAGILSHLLLDMLNPAGVPFLWPWSKRFSLAGFHSGGLVDWLLGIGFVIGCLITLFHGSF